MRSGINVRRQRAAFTLIELLVVVAVICILLAIMVQSIRAAGFQLRRTMDVRHSGNSSLACQIYAADNNNWYPVGYYRGGGTYGGGHDHIIKMWGGSWQMLRDDYGLAVEDVFCYTTIDEPAFAGFVTNAGSETPWGGTYLGRVYWAGRRCPPVCSWTDWCTGDPVAHFASAVQTTSPVTSKTMWACWTNAPAKGHWGVPVSTPSVPHGLGNDSLVMMPNQGMLGEWNCRADLLPEFAGLTCSYTDGSARWAPYKDLAWAGCEYNASYYDGAK